MLHQIISAGFGGQGVLLLGQLIAYSGLQEGKNVSWLPSYGPEMCAATLSSRPIAWYTTHWHLLPCWAG